jgi:serpin B
MRNNELQAVELPYRDPQFAALLVMPLGAGEPGEVWRRWLAELEGGELQDVWRRLRERQVNLLVPRFQAETQLDPSRLLGRLGMERVWGGASELGGMADRPLQLSRIQQRARLLFHEDGTEAAAVTAAVVASSANSLDLVFDRPFLFVLHERPTGQIVFAGWVAQATARGER